jgi:hypothetical protein
MEVIQEKLREVIQKGSVMSSSEQISSMLDVSDGRSDDEISVEEENQLEIDGHQQLATKTTIPEKTAGRKRKLWIDNVAGQSGARLARKVISRAKSHGKWKNGSYVTKSRPARKKRNNKNLCAF